MSRVYDALQQMEKEKGRGGTLFPQPTPPLSQPSARVLEVDAASSVSVNVSLSARLVALSEPRGLGAEKFRALATRLENLRRKKEFKSLQITSSVINEGKTLVAANLAVTFAKHLRSKVLLLEGDLHRPSMAAILGLKDVPGITHWWMEKDRDITSFLCRLNEIPLWLLSAGANHQQPSHVLQSNRFVETFNRLTDWFDWIVVDSTPMLPIADVNLWSRLVDGTLLVVREGVAPIEALKKGMQSVDNLKLLGTVLNDASESRRAGYADQYYGTD